MLGCAYVFVTMCRDTVSLSLTTRRCDLLTYLTRTVTLEAGLHSPPALAPSGPARKVQGLDGNPRVGTGGWGERQTFTHTARSRCCTTHPVYLISLTPPGWHGALPPSGWELSTDRPSALAIAEQP